MNEAVRKVDTPSLVSGLVLIGFGIVFLLDQFRFIRFGDLIGTHWPLVLVVIGVPRLFHREKVWSGLWLVTAGTWFELVNMRLFGLTYANSWPLLVIALGAGITLRAIFDTAGHPGGEHHE